MNSEDSEKHDGNLVFFWLLIKDGTYSKLERRWQRYWNGCQSFVLCCHFVFKKTSQIILRSIMTVIKEKGKHFNCSTLI